MAPSATPGRLGRPAVALQGQARGLDRSATSGSTGCQPGGASRREAPADVSTSDDAMNSRLTSNPARSLCSAWPYIGLAATAVWALAKAAPAPRRTSEAVWAEVVAGFYGLTPEEARERIDALEARRERRAGSVDAMR